MVWVAAFRLRTDSVKPTYEDRQRRHYERIHRDENNAIARRERVSRAIARLPGGTWIVAFIETMNEPYVGRPWLNLGIGVVVVGVVIWAFSAPR